MFTDIQTCCSCYRCIDGVPGTCISCLQDVCQKCLLVESCKSCHSKLPRCTYCGSKLISGYEEEIHYTFDTCQTGYHCQCRRCNTRDHSENPNECLSCDKIIRIEAREDVDDMFCDLCVECQGFCLRCFCRRDILVTPSWTCDFCDLSILPKYLLVPIAAIVMEYVGFHQQPIEFVTQRVKTHRGRRTCRIKSIVLTVHQGAKDNFRRVW